MVKRLGKDVLGYGFGVGITKSLGLISLPLVTHYFSVEQVGLLELCLALVSIAILLILLGIDTGLTYFYWNDEKTSIQNSYITTSFSIVIFSASVIVVLLLCLKSFFEKYYFHHDGSEFYTLLIFSIVAQAFFLLSNKVLRIKRVIKKYNIVILTNAIAFLASLYFLLNESATLENFFIAKIIGFFFATFICLLFIVKSLSSKPELSKAKELVKYSLPLVPFAITATLMTVLDKVFINHILGVSSVGVFSVGAKIGASIILLITAFSMAYGPFAMSIKKEQNAKEIYSSVFLLYASVMLFFVLALISVDSLLVKILTPNNEVYLESISIIGPTALALVIYSFFSQLGIGLNLTRNNKYFFYGSIVALLVNISLNPVLINFYGAIGASYASLISYLIICIWVYFVAKSKYPIYYPLKLFFYIASVFSIIFVVIQNFSEHNDILFQIIASLVYALLVFPILVVVIRKSNRVSNEKIKN